MPEAKQFCERRNELAELLTDIAVRLSIAAVEMARVTGTSENETFLRAKVETERLRDEGEALRAELAHHRLKHGC
ncbi:MAG: hypothetical protein JO097_10935 [Acidobacteriaceae bacterium]|nr:hypothetical protein [Acidobacteriaceae bacterium]